MTAFNFLSLGFENFVAYQIKLFHFNYDILNCYQLSDGPERLGRSEYLQFMKILGNYCSMCWSRKYPYPHPSRNYSFGSGRAPPPWKFPTFLPGVDIDIFSKNTLKNSSTLLKLSFEICLQLYSHTDYSKIEDVRPEASWVYYYSYTKKEMTAVNEVNLVCFF